MNILFIGVGYFPYLTSSEKNFFFHLVPLLTHQADIAIFSLNDQDKTLTQEIPGGSVPVYCARRPFHRDYERFLFRGSDYIAYHHRHKPPQEIIEKFVSIVRHLPRLRQVISQHQIELIHFMDNFGLAMPFLRKVFPQLKVTYSAANYDPRGCQALYNFYLKQSIGYLNGAGVYTQAYLQKLRQIGIHIPLQVTRWGVPVPECHLDVSQKLDLRKRLGIGSEQCLLLWSGYLQQIREADFYKSIRIARRVTQAEQKVTFMFAFKPETFKHEYSKEASDRVHVISGLSNFGAVLETADLFFSPIGNIRSTVSPPLTWLEAMSKGTPVITTAVGGVDEIIHHNQTGYVALGYDELENTITQAIHDNSLESVAQRAREFVCQEFNIQRSAETLLQFWQKVVGNE